MPGADYAAIENPSFAQWTVLVLADVGKGRELVVVAKDGDALITQRDDLCTAVGNVGQSAGIDELSIGAQCRDVVIDLALAPAGQQVDRQQPGYACNTPVATCTTRRA